MSKVTIFLIAAAFTPPTFCLAQDSGSDGASLSGSVSDSLASSSQTSGLDSSFDPSTASLNSPSQHSDINDPTHAQLLGSRLSPFDNALVNASVQTSPQTAVISDAQSTVGLNDFAFGGHRNLSFTPGASSHTLPSAAALPGGGAFSSSSSQAAFRGAVSASASFNGRAARASAAPEGFSGESAGSLASTSPVTSSRQVSGISGMDAASSVNSGYAFPDPVLTGSTAGYDTGSGIHGDFPVPSSQTTSFFAEPSTPNPVFEFDDGQTPLGGRPSEAGSVLAISPVYMHSGTGFPDSTKGLAGSPDELDLSASPFSPPGNTAAGPFAPVSGGTVYEPKTRLNPSLHGEPLRATASFEQLERRLRQARLTHGASISQADSAYHQDIEDYHRNYGRVGRKTTLAQPNQGVAGYQPELIGRSIR